MHDAEELLSHADFLRRLAMGLLRGDASAADDVVQETYLASLRSGGAPPRDPRAWLVRVARNLVYRRHRGETRRRQRERTAAPGPASPATAESAARLELQRRVVAAVADLDEPYRTAIVLRYFDDLAPGAIASRLGIPKETVRTRLTRALRRLRARLDKDIEGGRANWSLALAALVVPGRGTAAAVTGGIVMSTKTKVAFVLLPLLGGVAGILGHAAYADRAPPARAAPTASGPARRLAALEEERDRLLGTLESLRAENDRLRDELEGARATEQPDEERVPSGDGLAAIDWKRYLPVFRSKAARDPNSAAREDPVVANARRELIREVATCLDDLPDEFAVDDLWRIPEVGARIAAVLAADLAPDLDAAAIEEIRTGVETALRQAESALPDPALDIERLAAVERSTAATEAVLAHHADAGVARRAAAVLGPLWRRGHWQAMHLGILDAPGLRDAVAGMHEELDPGTRARVGEVAARMHAAFVETRARLVRELDEPTVRAFLIEPGHGGDDEAVLAQRRKREDYPALAQRLRAEFAAQQARFERELYDTLPPAAQEQQRMIAATLFLFDVKR